MRYIRALLGSLGRPVKAIILKLINQTKKLKLLGLEPKLVYYALTLAH